MTRVELSVPWSRPTRARSSSPPMDARSSRRCPRRRRFAVSCSPEATTRASTSERATTCRRGSHYRNPSATQQTSARISGLLIAHLATGGVASIATADSAGVICGGSSTVLNLTTKAARVLAEHAALVAATLDGETVQKPLISGAGRAAGTAC